MLFSYDGDKYIDCELPERLDSNNASTLQGELNELVDANPSRILRLRAENLEYVSSAGLRIFLELSKRGKLEEISGTSNEIFGILEMTGLTGIIEVGRRANEQKLESSENIGADSYGYLYRPDPENIVRIYTDLVSEEAITGSIGCSQEALREDIRSALVVGTVKSEKGLGCQYVSEDFVTLSSALKNGILPEEAMDSLVEFLDSLHACTALEDNVEKYLDRLTASVRRSFGTESEAGKIISEHVRKLSRNNVLILESINPDTFLISGGKPVLTDYALLRYGNPLFELVGIYSSALKKEEFFGNEDIDGQFKLFLSKYLKTKNEKIIENFLTLTKEFSSLMLFVYHDRNMSEEEEKDLIAKISVNCIRNSERLTELIEAVKDFQDMKPGIENAPLKIVIRERTARKLFKKKTLLKDISMTMYPGEMVLLLGSSGAGKTTFLNAVTGYEKADASISIGDLDVYKNYELMKHMIAFAPQQDLLRNDDSVYNTLKNAAQMRLPIDTSPEQAEEEIRRMLDIFGLADMKNSFIGTLSGGQRKRASIAVEFISNPVLFFLDEPDSGLDGVMARSLMEDLRKITGNSKIIVVISHAPDRVIDLFDKVIILTKSETDGAGHLAFYGSPKEAREFFETETMEQILKLVNRKGEGGEGRADEFIEKYRNWR